jgi:long-chain acyl-CoA synthetase
LFRLLFTFKVLFEDTCKQWTIALQGAFSQSITVATCYGTLGEEAVIAAVNQTQVCHFTKQVV